VTSLNLSGEEFIADQLDTIMGALPGGIESIILDDQVIHRNGYYVNKLLADVAHLTAKQGMARFAFDAIELPIEIDGNRLNRFIEVLEQKNNPIADFTCALLLEGQIETTTDLLYNSSEFDEHIEKRAHDAISFYTKAANDATIKPIAEFLLWEMKTTSPFASIQNRLAQYDVTPQGTCSSINTFNSVAHNRQGIITPMLVDWGLFKRPEEAQEAATAQTSPVLCQLF
jgi:hypothetical protein